MGRRSNFDRELEWYDRKQEIARTEIYKNLVVFVTCAAPSWAVDVVGQVSEALRKASDALMRTKFSPHEEFDYITMAEQLFYYVTDSEDAPDWLFQDVPFQPTFGPPR